jgi:hypothetical protein
METFTTIAQVLAQLLALFATGLASWMAYNIAVTLRREQWIKARLPTSVMIVDVLHITTGWRGWRNANEWAVVARLEDGRKIITTAKGFFCPRKRLLAQLLIQM